MGRVRGVPQTAGTGLAGAGLHLPEHREDLAVLRVVCRNGFSLDLADLFFKDLLAAVDNLKQEAGASVLSRPAGFRHCSRTSASARVRGC